MLNKREISGLIANIKLVEDYVNLDKQLTPNGIDLTAGRVFKFCSAGALDFSNSERDLGETEEIIPRKSEEEDKFGWWMLSPGAYKVRTNEIINMPNNLSGIAYPRTSLLRMGVFTHNGVWDAGFSGRSEFVFVVSNPFGLKLKQNARVIQLVFFRVEETEAYNGIYNGL